jgi:nicotinamidase-related amidase
VTRTCQDRRDGPLAPRAGRPVLDLHEGHELWSPRGTALRAVTIEFMTRRGLLIIDMQEGLVPGAWRGEELADRIGKLAELARRSGAPIVAVQQTGAPGTEHDPEAAGWQLSRGLRLEDDDIRVSKTSPDSFFGTDLAQILGDKGVDTVVVTGLATDICVDTTVRSALRAGFDVDLVSDGHSPSKDGDPGAGMSPDQVVAHHNGILGRLGYPGRHIRLMEATEVSF